MGFKINELVKAKDSSKDIFGVITDIKDNIITVSDGNHLYDMKEEELIKLHVDNILGALKNTSDIKNIETKEYEMVDHPQHYHPGIYEAIKVIEAWLGKEGCYNFCIANAIKYISRLGLKPDAKASQNKKTIEDINKAIWYLEYAKGELI